jgi:DNA invertase Pin-like site-specific DNA recombinase
MSTDAQLKGDSLRRQKAMSQAYVEEHGLELVQDFSLEDIGVSAFGGQNAETGALGKFLAAVDAGQIPNGSYLLVESLDRISRETPQRALGTFLRIINSGIVLVTIADGRTYTADTAKIEDLLYSLIVMSRSHEESATKSDRISRAWAKKRSQLIEEPTTSKKLTAVCPAWLTLSHDRKNYIPIPERQKIIETIFNDHIAGIGAYKIARRFNEQGIPAFKGQNGWHESTIKKILSNRSVIGEFQPHLLVGGRRVEAGPPLPNYFPSVIDQETFNKAQAERIRKRKTGGGRRGVRISNLFSKIAKCAYCESQMAFENKGGPPKGGQYLICSKAKRHSGCEGTRWNYSDFELSFLAFVEELDLGSILTTEADAASRAALTSEIDSLNGQILLLQDERNKAYELLKLIGPDISFVATKIRECEAKLADAQISLTAATEKLSSQATMASTYYESKDQIKRLIAQVRNAEGEDIYKTRAQIAKRLTLLVHKLTIAPNGEVPLKKRTINFLENIPNDDNPSDTLKVRAQIEQMMNDPAAHRKYFVVQFADGTFRAIYPNPSNPLLLEQQIRLLDDAIGVELIGQDGQRILFGPTRKSMGLDPIS